MDVIESEYNKTFKAKAAIVQPIKHQKTEEPGPPTEIAKLVHAPNRVPMETSATQSKRKFKPQAGVCYVDPYEADVKIGNLPYTELVEGVPKLSRSEYHDKYDNINPSKIDEMARIKKELKF